MRVSFTMLVFDLISALYAYCATNSCQFIRSVSAGVISDVMLLKTIGSPHFLSIFNNWYNVRIL